jgi:hypothetical protein
VEEEWGMARRSEDRRAMCEYISRGGEQSRRGQRRNTCVYGKKGKCVGKRHKGEKKERSACIWKIKEEEEVK